jgi:hypothetical protein
MKRCILAVIVALLAATAAPALAGPPNRYFLVRDTQLSPQDVVATAKAYVDEQGWMYVNDAELKGVIFVKFCVPALAKDIFAAGDHIAALLPCGSMAIYPKDGKTQISMLHPGYMNALYPDPNLARAAEKGLPLFQALLDAVTR